MQRIEAFFHVNNINLLKTQMLSWANRFSICCFMDSHDYEDRHHRYDCLLAVDVHKSFSPKENILSQLDTFYNENDDWIFGHLNYDLKNEIEALESNHVNKTGFPDIFLFIPKVVLILKGDELTIESIQTEPKLIFQELQLQSADENVLLQTKAVAFSAAINKEEYIETVKKLQQHILRGDCYEINYCIEFFAEKILIEPVSTFRQLLKVSPTPFSSFYKLENKYLLCASPERFLSKMNNNIFSQPIKGTSPRSDNIMMDNLQKKKLQQSVKERSENVMIVDLVRNDLSKICKEGTVETEELFGIYSFPQVHQMISTIKGELNDNISFAEIMHATFPMGSMTGAPKLRAMQLIEQFEKTKRQLFSGSIGYISPKKNFDFNVVIRSLFYNSETHYLNYLVGSGITYYAEAEKEYAECLLKAKAIVEALQ